MEADVAIIGMGPAGLQAAIHASRRKASTVVVGKPGASAASGAEMDNYFGTGSVSGDDLIARGMAQAESTGAVLVRENVISAGRSGDSFELRLEGGDVVSAKAVVIATGVSRTKLGIPGEKELFGKGVSYCAVCDCGFYRGRRVVIVGNESEAAVSAEMMTGFASETSWVAWDMQASPVLVSKARDAGVPIHGSRPKAVLGTDRVEGLELEDGTVIPADGVFIELGARSSADIAMDLDVMPETDDSIKVDGGCATSVPGVFACGDVTGRPWQVAKAVGQGCVAGTNAAAYAKGER